MAELGGYLAVSYLAEHVFTDALDALWWERWEEAYDAVQWGADTPFGRLEASGGVSLDKPGMAFRGAKNAIEIHITGATRADLTLGGNGVGGVFIAFDAIVSLPVNVTQENPFFKAVVDLSGFALDSAQLRLTWFDGPNDPNGEAALLSPKARKALTDQVRKRAARYLTFRLPTDQIFVAEAAVMTKGIPGSVVIIPTTKLGNVRILDGWFALGIDDNSTHGNAAAIGPPPDAPPPSAAPKPQANPGEGSLRLILDPTLMLAYLKTNARLAVITASATRPNLHPNTDAIGVALEDDTIVLNAIGTIDAPDPLPGVLPFTVNVRIRPFISSFGDPLWVYASIKPNVRVFAPRLLFDLAEIVDFFGGDAFAKLNRLNRSEMPMLFEVTIKSQHVPETSDMYASIEGRQIVIRPNLFGIYGEASVWYGTYNGFWSIDRKQKPEEVDLDISQPSVYIRERFLQLGFSCVRLWYDSTFRIRYSIKRGSNGIEVVSGVTWSGTSKQFGEKVDLWDEANVLEETFTVELVAERPPGTEVGRVVHTVRVLDPFDRSHPFVRWRHQHYYRRMGDKPPITRLSAIHKTAIRERCKFCDVRSGGVFGSFYVMQALDALPAPEEEGFSTRLCMYCFSEQQ
jgi:hypothetical protein